MNRFHPFVSSSWQLGSWQLGSWQLGSWAVAFLLLQSSAVAEDSIELLSGVKALGTVKGIRKAEMEFDFEMKVGDRTSVRTFPFSKVHAVTMMGKRYVLTELPQSSAVVAERVERSRDEVNELIDSVGPTLPDWYERTPMKVPRTLNLAWPAPPKQQWDNKKYPGHYVWDVINPNPGRWKEGVKLMHHIATVNKTNRTAQINAMNQLGTLYAGMFEDWARAAYWWRQAGKGTQGAKGQGGFRVGYEVGLAKCYWKLGNKEMAVEALKQGKGSAAYLWAEMGEHDRALKVAERAVKDWQGTGAYIICGDVCRHGGRYEEALGYYQRVASQKETQKSLHAIRNAKERIAAMRAERSVDLTQLKDGTYKGQSIAYSGMLDVVLTVRDHEIATVKVTRHVEKQYYSAMTDIPAQIVRKQSVGGIDATSGATITAEAIVRASAKALAAKR
jgi:uncharacterized protein with FMN-binding domain